MPRSFGIGIDLGDSKNQVLENDASGAGTTDLIDENANCDGNLWDGNFFKSAHPSGCIH